MTLIKQLETNRRGARRVTVVALGSVALVLAGSAGAQQPRATAPPADDARWTPWVGCWQRSGDTGAGAQLTCVRPSTGSAAEILTIANGQIESRERLVVDGLSHPIERDGCRGSQTATWSASGHRIYVGAAYSCAGGLNGRSTRMFAIVPSGTWLDIRNVQSGGGWVETITRFHDAGLPRSVPAAVRSDIARRELAIATARAAASAPVSASDIAEASRAVDTVVVQSWLAARGQLVTADSTSGASQGNLARVYQGSPAPTRPAAPPPAPAMEPGCDAFGCYGANAYSTYNGYSYSPYARTYVYGYPAYYAPYPAVVVIRGGGRVQSHGKTVGVRPSGGHPTGGRPIGGRPGELPPVVHQPTGFTPSSANPPGPAPRVGLPNRIRP